MTSEPRLPFEDDTVDGPRPSADSRSPTIPRIAIDDRRPATDDEIARRHAIDPSENVVLEASAGTGKTRVLVERYVNLLLAGVDPGHILAITFTRKAAAEMRQRIIARLREMARLSHVDGARPGLAERRWQELRERLGDIAISTIDAFCLSLVREFPLEAGVDPGFDLADETEIPRLVDEALDATLRIGRHLAQTDSDLAMLFVQLGERRLRVGLTALLDRRLVARDVLRNFLAFGPRDLTPELACRHAARRLRDAATGVPGGLAAFLEDGPRARIAFTMLARDLRRLCAEPDASFAALGDQAALRALIERLRGYFVKQDGEPREGDFAGSGYKGDECVSAEAWKRHRQAAAAIARPMAEAIRGFRRDLNAILARGVWRMFSLASTQYVRTLEAHAVLDFSEVLSRALDLLRQMEEFSRSRYRLESRYRHVLVDELQDTSRAQWELVSLLVQSWGEGAGASADALPPSIFVVGDRKQSIYGFRDAEVAVLGEAADFIDTLRPDGQTRHAIIVSFRARPALLAFVNRLFADIAKASGTFRYDERDRFPVVEEEGGGDEADAAVRFIAGATVEQAAGRVADEIVRLLATGALVRDRETGLTRAARPADFGVLFRSRDSHREYEEALDRRAVPAYVYKGLGFFDADEVQDAMALLRFLADPTSNIRAAALLRSRIVRLSDRGVTALGPRLAAAVAGSEPPGMDRLDGEDRAVLQRLREAMTRWLAQVDRITPAELLDAVLRETAYAFELRGARRRQAYENLKKLRGLIRRIQNRGYATLARISDHLEQLALGDESNAVVDAMDAVSLMTVHAAKGLEFPIVFVVNLNRGTGGPRPPIRAVADANGTPSVAIGDFESEADEGASARDRDETRRLLYVALTRARDRLYLSGVVKDGAFKPGPGSLGAVLPAWVTARIEESSTP